MEVSCQEFVDSLVSLSEGLQVSLRETMEYWRPDEPPVTILFAALGHQIAEDFDVVGADVNQRVFRLVEEAMGSGDIGLVTAVATGLIEAITAEAAHKEGLWPRIAPMLGELSRRHAEAWLAP